MHSKLVHLLFFSIVWVQASHAMYNCAIKELPKKFITTGIVGMIAAPIVPLGSSFCTGFCPARFQNWYDKHNLGIKIFSSLIRACCLPLLLGGALMLSSRIHEDKVLGFFALGSGLSIMYADFRLDSRWKFPATKTGHVLRSKIKNDSASYIGGGLLYCGIAALI